VPEAGTEADAGDWNLATGNGQNGCACSVPGVSSARAAFSSR
jgi:hypothetical protein